MTLTDHTQLTHQSSVLKCCSNPMNLFPQQYHLWATAPSEGTSARATLMDVRFICLHGVQVDRLALMLWL